MKTNYTVPNTILPKSVALPLALATGLAAFTANAGVIPSPSDLGLSGGWKTERVFNLNTVGTGSTPIGAKPWVTVAFLDQSPTDNSVWMVVSAKGLSSSKEFVSEIAFNFNPDSVFKSTPTKKDKEIHNLTPFTFSDLKSGKTGGGLTPDGVVAAPAFSQGQNLKPEGLGNSLGTWDFAVAFGTSDGESGKNRLDAGEWFACKVTWNGAGTLPLDDFFVKNDKGNYAAAHIQGIPSREDEMTSGKILSAVPEPGEYSAVAAMGLAGFAVWRRRQTGSKGECR